MTEVTTVTALLQGDSQMIQTLAVAVVEQAPDGILAVDPDGRIVFVNSQVERMFGYSRQELLGQQVELLVPEEIRQKHVQNRRGYAANPQTRGMKDDGLLSGRRKDGTEFPAQISLGPVATPGSFLIVCFVRDMTRMQQVERRLSQTEKMESIGHLAGGIAHDFNNLLTIINGHSEALFRSLKADFRACQRIQEIAKAGDKAAQLTRQLLAFSRQQILRPRVLNLNELVTDFQRMLSRLIGENIILTSKLSVDLAKVKADPGQIEQVLMNLAVNARDAMPEGGHLTIETANIEIDTNFTQLHPEVKPGHYVLLAVSDTGCGMDKQTMMRIFEPFFTTKALGKGTGFGLATSYGIVKQSGGFIYACSEVGHGTTFNVYLPLCEQMPAVAPSQDVPPPRGGSETVLLVEDEEGVRALLRSTLEENGYKVLEAIHGKEALAIGRAYGQPIHLLLTDVVMPEMGGRVLAEQFAAVRPEVKALFMSGYTDDMVVRHGVLEAEVEFIQKPYTMASLLEKIRAMLDQGKTRHPTTSIPLPTAEGRMLSVPASFKGY